MVHAKLLVLLIGLKHVFAMRLLPAEADKKQYTIRGAVKDENIG
jgi:hypothetical protein